MSSAASMHQTLAHGSALTTEQKHQLRSRALHLGAPASASPHTPTRLHKSSAITGSAQNITRTDLDLSILDVCFDSGGSDSIDSNVRSIRFTTAASNIDRLIGSPLSVGKKPVVAIAPAAKAPVLTPVSVMSDIAPSLSDRAPLSQSSADAEGGRGQDDDDEKEADLGDGSDDKGTGAGDADVDEDDSDARLAYSKNIRLRDDLTQDGSTENVKRRLSFTTKESGSLVAQSSMESAESPRRVDTVRVEISELTWSELSPCRGASADVVSHSRGGVQQTVKPVRQDPEERVTVAEVDDDDSDDMDMGDPDVTYGSMTERARSLRDSFSLTRLRLQAEAQERDGAKKRAGEAEARAQANEEARAQAKADHEARMKTWFSAVPDIGEPMLYQPDPARYAGVTHKVPYGESKKWERDLLEGMLKNVPFEGDLRGRRSTVRNLRESFSALSQNVKRLPIWKSFMRKESR